MPGYKVRNIQIWKDNGGAAASSLVAPAAATTSGDTVVGIASCEDTGATLNSVASSTGDSATILGPYNIGTSPAGRYWIWYKVGITGNASDVWTATWAASYSAVEFMGIAVDGIGSYVGISSNATSDSGSVMTSNNVTTSNAYAFLVGAAALFNNATWRGQNGFTIANSPGAHEALSYKIQDRTGTYASKMTSTVADAFGTVVVEFAPEGGLVPQAVWTCGHSMNTAAAPLEASTTSIAIDYVGGEEDGDYLLAHIVSKHANAVSTAASGWNLLTSATVDTGSGVDNGETRHYVFYKECDGTETGTVTFTKTTETGTMLGGLMFRYKGKNATQNAWATPAATTATDDATGTAVSLTGAADPGVSADDMLVVGVSDISDVGADTTWIPSSSLSQTGCTFDTPGHGYTTTTNDGQAAAWGTTQGDDGRLAVLPYYVLTGPSSAAPAWTTTAAGSAGDSHKCSAVFVRLRIAAPQEGGGAVLTRPAQAEWVVTVYA